MHRPDLAADAPWRRRPVERRLQVVVEPDEVERGADPGDADDQMRPSAAPGSASRRGKRRRSSARGSPRSPRESTRLWTASMPMAQGFRAGSHESAETGPQKKHPCDGAAASRTDSWRHHKRVPHEHLLRAMAAEKSPALRPATPGPLPIMRIERPLNPQGEPGIVLIGPRILKVRSSDAMEVTRADSGRRMASRRTAPR